MPYSTKQQQAVLRCLEQRREKLLTAADLAEDLRRESCPVGAFYQFCSHDANGHRDCFLLKCEKCGCIRHLDCSHLQILYDHLEQDHHFRINPRRTLFLGLCEECAGKEAEEHGSHQ